MGYAVYCPNCECGTDEPTDKQILGTEEYHCPDCGYDLKDNISEFERRCAYDALFERIEKLEELLNP